MSLGSMVAGGLAYKSNKQAQKGSQQAAADLTRRMDTAQQDITAYRPEAAEARMRALRARLGVLEPLNNMTAQVTGQPQADLSGLAQSPANIAPLPSEASAYGPNGKIDETKMRAYGIDPRDPNAQSLLQEKLRGYGYNIPAPVSNGRQRK